MCKIEIGPCVCELFSFKGMNFAGKVGLKCSLFSQEMNKLRSTFMLRPISDLDKKDLFRIWIQLFCNGFVCQKLEKIDNVDLKITDGHLREKYVLFCTINSVLLFKGNRN